MVSIYYTPLEVTYSPQCVKVKGHVEMSQSSSLLSFRFSGHRWLHTLICQIMQIYAVEFILEIYHLTCRLHLNCFVDNLSLTEKSFFMHVVEMRQSMPVKVKYVLDLKMSCLLPHSLLVCCDPHWAKMFQAWEMCLWRWGILHRSSRWHLQKSLTV